MKRYRLTENRLRGMIREAVKGALNEHEYEKNEQVDDEFSQQLTAEIQRYCNSKFSIKYEPYRMAYEIIGGSEDDSLWATFLFAMLDHNLKVVKYGSLGNTTGYIWFEK